MDPIFPMLHRYSSEKCQKTKGLFGVLIREGGSKRNTGRNWLIMDLTQLTFTCSKSTTKTLEKGAKYVQS